jgi:hypothetical protein
MFDGEIHAPQQNAFVASVAMAQEAHWSPENPPPAF